MALQEWLDDAGLAAPVGEPESLMGGLIAQVWRVRLDDGTSVIVKHDRTALPDMFELETDGLRALAAAGVVPVCEPLGFGDTHIIVSDMGPRRTIATDEWRDLGRAMATLHAKALSPDGRFGWPRDGYQGRMAMPSPWTDDGIDFYVNQRILRWLPEPKCEETLTAEDRAGIERCCERLRDVGLEGGAVLTHGDLWSGNICPIAGEGSGLAIVDPSVSYNWPEVDLTTMDWDPSVPNEPFFGGYEEVRPLAEGREERWAIMHLREHLAMVAHFADEYATMPRLRETLAKYGS